MKEAKWNQEYDVGIAGIDNAHRALFSAVKKIFALLDAGNSAENRTACVEALNQLRDDMLRHFAEEESYMQYIGYEGYERHKRQHDRARDELLAMEQMLVHAGYDPDSVLRALGQGIGWMTGHVPEDMAITGKGFQRTIPVMSDFVTKLELVIADVVRGMFHMQAELEDEHYKGQDIGDVIYHELHYLSERDNRRVRYLVVMETRLIEAVTGTLLSKTFHGLNQMILAAMREITHMIFLEVGTYFRDEVSHFELVYENVLTPEEAQDRFRDESPFYSLLFRMDSGRFAVCFNIDG